MTSLDQGIGFLHVAINALVLWFVWHVNWRRACQERYRQKLFEVRDELFDYARSGGIDFKDPAYVAVRSFVNSLMRFSHRISVTRLATFVLFQRYIGDTPKCPPVEYAISHVKGKAAKETLAAIVEKVNKHTLWHLLFASPHILLLAPPLVVLDGIISKKPRPNPVLCPPQRHAAVILIEVQAREAYKSEAIKRETNELVPLRA